ncbi:CSPG4 protein, partial [Polypterus senegalus]
MMAPREQLGGQPALPPRWGVARGGMPGTPGAHPASFYGDGYVELKTVESSNRTSLHFRFRTSKPNGLLFLAAGNHDYCLAELKSGHLQVKINLGSGERILHSDKANPLNDLAWHTVELQHDNNNVILTADKHFTSSVKMPGKRYELNIDDGLYVGGTGGLAKAYLINEPSNFRGCIDDLLFNQHNILSSLRSYYGFKNVYEVSLGCSPQFFANEEDPISFFSSKAFVSFPLWNTQEEGIFESVIHTSSDQGVLLYSSGQKEDFVAMEIRSGILTAVIGKGGNKYELSSKIPVNDRKWHYVKLRLTSKHLQLTLDQETEKRMLESRGKNLILRTPLYVGGIEDGMRAEVGKLGLTSILGRSYRGASFKGCIKDIKINSERIGLNNATVTKDISVGCEPEKEPEPLTEVVPTIVNLSPTIAGVVTTTKQPEKKRNQNFVVLRTLVVAEGGRGSLESKNIKLNLEFKALGLRQSQILFKIEEQPVHGQLRLDVDEEQEENTFTMLDLWHGRVMYIHGGSEDPLDYFTFSVFTNSKKEVPSYLKGDKRYRFNITVTPTNDAPELTLPEGNLFVVLENSKKRLTSDVLKAVDVDSNSTSLIFSLLGNLNSEAGFLENSENPSKAITTFRQTDLEEGKIYYVHTGVRTSRIVLRVSDGEKISNTVVLRIMAVPLDYKFANNTGIEVIQGGTALINNSHLAIQTNAVRQEIEIRFDITETPLYGEVQRWHPSGEWKVTNMFSQRTLERERVRYVSTFRGQQRSDVSDQFKCKVSIGGLANDEVLFAIKVKWVQYKLLKNKALEIDKVKRMVFSQNNLNAILKGSKLAEHDLFYRVLTLPQKGRILLNNETVKEKSVFSQKNVTDKKVEYELIDRPKNDSEDIFTFQLFSKYADSAVYKFKIVIKADMNSIILSNNGLALLEGESKLITKSELFAETLNSKAIKYKVTNGPKHGNLKRINLSDSSSSNNNITDFTNQDILDERIIYVHDDSESTHDEFIFIASIIDFTETEVLEAENAESEGTFSISIELKNDEKPVRVVDKVFQVVRNGQRLLTTDDLCYHDADSDFNDGQLLYTRRGIPNGDLILVNNASQKLYQFRQEDLEEKRVLFVHRGADYSRFVLFVTDGKHYTSSLLEVSAQEPFLKVSNNTGLLVQKGKEANFSSANFSIVTNLDIRHNREITYEVFALPKFGRLYLKGLPVESFTHDDLEKGHLVYHHDNSNNLVDKFSFTVKAEDVSLDASIHVRVYLESHQRPPKVVHNSSLLVEEGKPVKISKRKLEVVHEDSLPSEIVFTIKTPPHYGYIRSFAEGKEHYLGTEQTPITSFTQQDINDGNIQYVQVAANQLTDDFVLDVTNEITEIKGILISIDIIPSVIPVQVLNFTIHEGSSKALTEDIIKVTNKHFAGLNFEYYVLDPPKHGYIENSRFPGMKLSHFTRKQVENEFIYYVHDNSESIYDNFTIIANDTDLRKQSQPSTMHVNIIPVNDEAPAITTNKILRVWVDSVTEITGDDLNAEDKDSSPAALEYIITPPSNGHLALKSATNRRILNFTQEHINQGQLVFVHNGAMSGGFNFQVNDGMNFAPRQIFSITARTLVINMESNTPLRVFPGSRTTISADNLRAVTNDMAGNRTISYTIVSSPKLGRLIRVGPNNSIVEISTFTQAMVDEGLIAYEQNNQDSIGWSLQDSFLFKVSSSPASLETEIFNITVSYDNTGAERRSQLLQNSGAVVTEGDKVHIDKSKLDASNLLVKLPETQRHAYEIWYGVTSLPRHGVIVVGERNLTKEKPNFSQFILNKYGITYFHDNSESKEDSFTFEVWLNLKSKTAIRPQDDGDVVEEIFNITIIPINDQPPELKTKTPRLSIVQGGKEAIGPQHLNVIDKDNSPEELIYTIISKPNNGHLAMDISTNDSILTFTQADINSGKIWFVQDGSPSAGVFYFSVTDGKHRPLYKLFNLDVIPITVFLSNNTGLSLEQGQSFVLVSSDQLAAETNGRSTAIEYRVTRPPQFGQLLIDNSPVLLFGQQDINQGRLFYHFTDSTASEDSFEFAVFTAESNLTDQVVNVTVKPLIIMRSDLKFLNEFASKLELEMLNATELARLSSSDPQFVISVPPYYGKILKSQKAKGTMEAVNSFTLQELKVGAVLLKSSANMTGHDVLNDSFTFVLRANNVQPAVGEFVYAIIPYDPSLVPLYSTLKPPLTTLTLGNNHSISQVSLFPTTTEPKIVTQKSVKPVQKWKGKNRWGDQDRSSVPEVTGTESAIRPRESTTKITAVRAETEASKATNPLFIILPVLACLLLTIILVVLILVSRHKKEKQRPLIQNHPNNTGTAPSSPNLCAVERSLTVPSVTVTPLQNSATSSPMMLGPRGTNILASGSPTDTSLRLCTWNNLDPETVKHCRTTNPTLRPNQYWV